MSANPSQRAPDRQRPPRKPSDSAERIRQMLKDLDMPLDGVPASRDAAADRRFAEARKQREREAKKRHRSDLSLAEFEQGFELLVLHRERARQRLVGVDIGRDRLDAGGRATADDRD